MSILSNTGIAYQIMYKMSMVSHKNRCGNLLHSRRVYMRNGTKPNGGVAYAQLAVGGNYAGVHRRRGGGRLEQVTNALLEGGGEAISCPSPWAERCLWGGICGWRKRGLTGEALARVMTPVMRLFPDLDPTGPACPR